MNRLNLYRCVRIGLLSILMLAVSFPISTQRAFAQTTQTTSDISIQMVADHNKVRMGEDVTYTVYMTNHGPDDATGVDVTFQMPDQLTMLSMTCDLGISADTPACEYNSLPAGVTLVSTMTATPNSAARTAGRRATVAAVASFEVTTEVDPDLSNNTASTKTKIIGRLPHP